MRMLILCLFLAGCGRVLTDNERDFAARLHGPSLDVSKVRIANKAPVRSYTLRIPKRPRVSCTERIYPPPKTDIVSGAPSAVALFNRIWANEDYYLDDYMPAYPKTLHLYEALFLAHELTHAW